MPSGRFSELVADDRTLKQVKVIAGLNCTHEEAGAFFDVSRSAFERFMEREPAAKEAWAAGAASFRMSLRRKQFALADTNAGMAIFLGKNYLGQRDVPEEGSGRDRPPAPQTAANDTLNLANLTPAELAILERALVKAQSPAAQPGERQEADGRALAG